MYFFVFFTHCSFSLTCFPSHTGFFPPLFSFLCPQPCLVCCLIRIGVWWWWKFSNKSNTQGTVWWIFLENEGTETPWHVGVLSACIFEPSVVKEDDQLNFLDCCIIPVWSYRIDMANRGVWCAACLHVRLVEKEQVWKRRGGIVNESGMKSSSSSLQWGGEVEKIV